MRRDHHSFMNFIASRGDRHRYLNQPTAEHPSGNTYSRDERESRRCGCQRGEGEKERLPPLLFGLFQFLNVMTEFECWPQLESHVLHDDVTAQQHQRFAVNLLRKEKVGAPHQDMRIGQAFPLRTIQSVANRWRQGAEGGCH